MSKLKTYAVEIWVTDCYLLTDIDAASAEAAERIAIEQWEQGLLSPVENMQEISSTHIEEMTP